MSSWLHTGDLSHNLHIAIMLRADYALLSAKRQSHMSRDEVESIYSSLCASVVLS